MNDYHNIQLDHRSERPCRTATVSGEVLMTGADYHSNTTRRMEERWVQAIEFRSTQAELGSKRGDIGRAKRKVGSWS